MVMAAPALLWASVAASAASTLVGAIGASNAAKANAKAAEAEGAYAKQQATVEEQRQRVRAERVRSSQRAALAASGVDLEGSPLLLLEETAAESEYDALLIRHGGDLAEVRARSEAARQRAQGRTALISGVLGAGATVLGGASEYSRLYGGKSVAAPAGMYNGGTGTNPVTGMRYGGV